MINNGFDLGKVAGDLTSKESLKGLGLNMATAGLTAGIGHGLGLESVAPGMDMAGRTKILAQQGLISGAVRTGLAGATGENVGQTWKDEALSMGLALGQSKIGDIAQDNGLKTGSIGKTALHSATGSLYSLATGSTTLSGAIGGATSEIVADVMESGKGTSGPPLTKEEQNDLNNKIKTTTKLTSATVTMLAGGDAKDMTISANVGESAVKHNRELHESEQKALKQLKKEAKTDQEKQDLEDAAAFKVRLHAGIDPKKDPENYTKAFEAYQRGKDKLEAQEKLVARTKLNQRMDFVEGMLPSSMGGDSTKLLSGINARHFEYDGIDKKLDKFTSSHDKFATRLGQTTQLLGGIGGTFASGALTLGSVSTTNVTGVALGSAGVAFGSVYAYDGLDALTSPYKSTTGERALTSLKGNLPGLTGKSKAAFSLANTILDVGGITTGSKVISTLQKPTLSGGSFTSKSVTTQVENTVTGDSSHLYGAKVRDVGSKGSGEIIKQQNVHIVNKSSPNPQYRVPGRVQSRIDLYKGNSKEGWNHLVKEHYNSIKNKSQFTIPKSELREVLQSKKVVKTPVNRILNADKNLDEFRYVREVDVGKVIGIDKFTGKPTSKITVLTNFEGKLITATPGVIK